MNSSIVKLGDIAKVFNGKTPAESEQRQSGFPVLKIRDVDENGVFRGRFDSFVDEELANQFPEKQICVNDVMILNAAHNADYVASKMFFANERVAGALSTGEWLIIRADNEKVDPRFIHFWLQYTKTKYSLRLLVKGIHLYPKDVAELNIPLPPLTEQKRIASLLARADHLRTLRRTAHDLGESLLQSVFLEIFGEVVRNDKGWERTEIREVAKIIVPTRDKPKRFSGDIPWVTLPDLNGLFVGDAKNLLAEEDAAEVGTRLMPTNTVLLSCAGSLGKIAITTRPVYTNQQFYGLIAKPDVLHYLFLAAQLKMFGEEFYFNMAGMSTLGFFSRDKALDIEIILPPLSLQEEFAGVVARVESLRGRMSEAGRQVNGLFESLLAQSFDDGR